VTFAVLLCLCSALFISTNTKTKAADNLLNLPTSKVSPDLRALIASGNSGDAGLLAPVRQLLGDASPLVRAMAVWALRQLAQPEGWAAARNHYILRETDAVVRAEWGVEEAP